MVKVFFLYLILFLFLGCGNQEFQADKDLFSESFSQKVQQKQIDIIMVVDNSLSMIRDQEKLSREFESFISSIQGADYRIGVITTDIKTIGAETRPGFYGILDNIGENGEKYISAESNDPVELFRRAIHREETQECFDDNSNNGGVNCVTQFEMPLRALKLAIEQRDNVNRDFFRPEAELGVVIITDEDETRDPDNGSLYTAIDFVTFFEEQFNGNKLLQVFAISIPEGEADCLAAQKAESRSGTAGAYGLVVSSLARLTGGFNVNICEDSFGTELERISEFVEDSLLITRIKIPGNPIRSSISLLVKNKEGIVIDIEWKIVGDYIELSPTPPEGSTISLSFRY